MKKLFLILLTLSVLVSCSPRSFSKTSNDKPILQIPVISDVHIGTLNYEQNHKDRFKKALIDIKSIAPDYKAIAFVGDITDKGANSEYNDFMSILKNGVNSDAEKIITMGNHEYAEIWYDKTGDDKVYTNRFISKTKMPGVYYDKWVEGYHFITLGGENLSWDNIEYPIISETQYNWLEKVLSIDAASDKPIFVFLHQPIKNTVYGSEYFNGPLTDYRLLNILKKYPQAILFSGHTHSLLSHPKIVYQDGFTMVNTGSVSNPWYNGGEMGDSSSQGLLVNVYKDKVEIKTREFSTGSWIQTFTVKIPFKKTIYDDKKPKFKINPSINVSNITETSAELTFSPAVDNVQIDEYVVKNNGQILYTDYVKYWKNSISKKYTIKLKDLEANKEYNLALYGKDAWGNLTDKTLKISFSTR